MTPAVVTPRLPAMTGEAIEKVRRLEGGMLALPQIHIHTSHVIHSGMYARTICIPAGAGLTGVVIKIPTILIFSGHATVFIGDDTIELCGYHVLPASAGRKQAFLAHADTNLTMLFATKAATVEQAENEFTDEAHFLFSRQHVDTDTIMVTGE